MRLKETWMGVGFLTLLVAGCNKEPPKAQPSSGVNVTTPNVNVQVDQGGGVKVNAPGVNVNVPTK